MSPAALAGLLSLLEALLNDAPSLVADIEALVARVKGTAPPPYVPLEPGLNQAIDGGISELENKKV